MRFVFKPEIVDFWPFRFLGKTVKLFFTNVDLFFEFLSFFLLFPNFF